MNHIERLANDRMDERFRALEKRISELEQKLKDRELEETLDIGRMASKDWVDVELSSRLRYYKEK